MPLSQDFEGVNKRPIETDFPKPGKKLSKPSLVGLILIASKIGSKIIPALLKFAKVIPKLLKGSAALKTAGAAGSLGLYTYMFSWQMGVSLVAFLFIHEYGHMWAMKKCGLKTRGMYLIPGFGAVALAGESFGSSKNEAYIAIMGPLFGLFFIAPMVAAYAYTGNPMYAAIASFMALVNLINLFPINPLDGGRIIKSLLYSFKKSFGFYFMFFSLVTESLGAIYMGLYLILYISIIGMMETVTDYGLAAALKRFIRTTMRFAFIYIAYKVFIGGVLLGTLSFSWDIAIILAIAILMFALDLYVSIINERNDYGQSKHISYLAYPFIVIKDIPRGLKEIFSIKPRHLKRIDGFGQMTRKQVMFYSLAYLLTSAIMIAAIVFAAHVPGVEHAKEILM